MRLFVILFLCIFVGDAFGDLQRVDKSMKPQKVDISKVIAVSNSVMQYFLNKLPEALKSKILVTDNAEKVVLENYVKSQSVPTKALDAYNLAKKDERELLKRLAKEKPRIVLTYKALRKGVAWNYTRLHEKFRKFFQEPSATLTHYEAFKIDELTSLDSFLGYSVRSGALEGTKNTSKIGADTKKLQGTENVKEAEIRKAEEAAKRKDEEEAKAKEARKRKHEKKAKAKETGKLKIEQVTIAKVEESKKPKLEDKTKAEEAEKTKNEEKAKEADKLKIEQVTIAKSEEAERPKSEDKTKAVEAEKPQNEEKANAKETDKLKIEQVTIAKAEEAEKPKSEDKTKAEVAETRNVGEVVRKSIEYIEIIKKSDKPFCEPLKLELSAEEKEEFVRAHNDARRREEATNMLQMVWDNELAIIAQYKANTCGYFHSMHKDCSQRALAQNLYNNFMTSEPKEYPPLNYTRVTSEWANERSDWDWATSTCHEGKQCGHWQTVTGAKGWKLGCGIARCPTLDVHGVVRKLANFIVCDYGPLSMEFERGIRCSNCGNSTADMDEKGFTCENELCVQCDPRKKPGCKCGPKLECRNGGRYLAEICGCKCPGEYYGEICEIRAVSFKDQTDASLKNDTPRII